MLAGRNIVLGVTGGVAAYKAVYLARRLIEAGAQVKTVMTPSARKFVGETTFAAITGHQPVVELFGNDDVSPHTTLARWADVVVIAPATASTIAKLASGDSSNALVATVLATSALVVVAPAMHTEMWEHPATQANIERITGFGYTLVAPQEGALAGGDEGMGRLAEPEDIFDAVDRLMSQGDMSGLSVLVTAGGTREPIDPVRYVGNRSSGKMGNALAKTAVDRGATVILVTAAPGPSDAHGIELVAVETASEMADAAWSRAADCDIAVMAAAVADFRPTDAAAEKLRRSAGSPDITFEATPDVLGGIADLANRPTLVGFAAEVGSLDAATEKARTKGVDLLVANDVTIEGSGFGSDENAVALIYPDGTTAEHPLLPKSQVANLIWDAVLDLRERT
ncbi:MAG: bifunctional phosphopantothenoylcysteine decarboxylase/phosphopantothenate--cysteine ligase CoaBC [Acidimicrobiia bacterium]|nr:MAG: bifunctional phosphopantothenoylcysteine decarboxylase/phosphopantothenate--cysteine ligase CoaBC [Acidimicrobiia bacterium]